MSRIVRSLLAASALCLCAGAVTAAQAVQPFPTNPANWVVNQTVALRNLTIREGQSITTAPGKNLTMTVNGTGTPIRPGNYRGNVVLSVTDDIPVRYNALSHVYRAALYVNDGKRVAEKSAGAAVVGGTVTDAAASGIRITSNEENFNGIYVSGNSKYTIDNANIRMTGNGGNDFAGFGSALMVDGKSEVTINKADIRTRGAVRTGLFIGGEAVVHVNDSRIETLPGTLPQDYKFNVDLGRMFEPPWMLGITGNVRATNLVARGTVYYNRSTIITDGWGALSVDDTKRARMYVTDSTIEVRNSGYCAYSIGDSHDHFTRSKCTAPDYGAIVGAEASLTLTEGSSFESGRIGVMLHTGVGGGTITLDKGSRLVAKETAIQAKGRGTTIVIDDATVTAGNGILIQAMPNDDPFMARMMAGPPPGGAPPGGGPPGGGPPGGPPGAPPGAPPGGTAPDAGTAALLGAIDRTVSPDVVATLRNVTLTGSIYNGRPAQGDMRVQLEKAHLTGTVSVSRVAPAMGKEPDADTYREIGHVVNTSVPASGDKGLHLALDGQSSWTAQGNSYLSQLTLAPGAVIKAPAGSRVTLSVNGAATALQPGTYSGNVLVAVAPGS